MVETVHFLNLVENIGLAKNRIDRISFDTLILFQNALKFQTNVSRVCNPVALDDSLPVFFSFCSHILWCIENTSHCWSSNYSIVQEYRHVVFQIILQLHVLMGSYT